MDERQNTGFEVVEDREGLLSILQAMTEAEDFDEVLELVEKAKDKVKAGYGYPYGYPKPGYGYPKPGYGYPKPGEMKNAPGKVAGYPYPGGYLWNKLKAVLDAIDAKNIEGAKKILQGILKLEEDALEFKEKSIRAKLASAMRLKSVGLIQMRLKDILKESEQAKREALSKQLKKLTKITDLDQLQKGIKDVIDAYPEFTKVSPSATIATLRKLVKEDDLNALKNGISELLKGEGMFKKSGGESVNIYDVELFPLQVYANGKVFTEKDADEIIENSVKLRDQLKPPLKLGHSEEQQFADGMPSLGTVENLRKENGYIVGDFKDVPVAIADLIRKKAYFRLSPEIYYNFVDNVGNSHGKALRAVALLGADVPAIKTLRDIEALYHKSSFSDKFGDWGITTESENDEKGGNMDEIRLENVEKTTQALQRENTLLKVDKFIEEHKTKILPTYEPIVRSLLIEKFNDDQKVIKFKEKDANVEMTVSEAVMQLIERLPDVVEFAETGESGEGIENPDLAEKQKIEKYAAENHVTFEEAYHSLMARGEIRE